jgi:hypothetical protein
MYILMAYVNDVINGYAYEDDDTCGLDHAKLPSEDFDHAHHTEYDGTYAEDSYEADI